MKRGGVSAVIALLAILSVAVARPAAAIGEPAPGFVWAAVIDSDSFAFATDVDVDSNGNSYVLGRFRGTADLDPGAGTFNVTSNGQDDLFVAKYSSSGAFLWGGSIGGPFDDDTGGIALDGAGGLYIGGMFGGTVDFDIGGGVANLTAASGDGFVLRLDDAGGFQWVVAQGDSVADVDAMADGSVNATGGLISIFDFDPGAGTTELSTVDGSVWVSELNISGGHVWAVAFEGRRVTALDVDADGNVYTGGTHEDGADMDPGVGTSTLPATGFTDMFIHKLDTDGNFEWAGGFGAADFPEDLRDIAVTTTAVYATGSFNDTTDFDPSAGSTTLTPFDDREDGYVLKWNNVGGFEWVVGMQAPGPNDLGTGVAIDAAGNVVATGYFTGAVDFDPGAGTFELTNDLGLDVYAWKLSPSGAFISAGAVGGETSSAEQARSRELALDAAGDPVIVGLLTAVNYFDLDPQSGVEFIPASTDGFVLKLDDVARCNGVEVTIDMNSNGGNGVGTAGNDVILGTAGDDIIRGNAGDDTACAGAGDDKVIGGPGVDTLLGEDGDDTIRGGGAGDTLMGGPGNDRILGQGGPDVIEGAGGNDTIDGLGAADTIDAGGGSDTVNGQNGADDITGGPGADTLKGQTGPDTIRGDGGDDDLFGGEGRDTLFGGPGTDRCAGNTGPDEAQASTCETTPGVETLF